MSKKDTRLHGLKRTHYRLTEDGALERWCSCCDAWLDATRQNFPPARTKTGIGGLCIPCTRKIRAQWEYNARRKRGEIKGKRPGWTWTTNWVEVADDAIVRMRKRVRSICWKQGLMWLYDDVYAEALVRMHQGNWVNARQVVFSVLDRELGQSTTARRQAIHGSIDDLRKNLDAKRLDKIND